MEPKDTLLYRGARVMVGWPDKVQAAQSVLTYTLNAKSVPRVRYGNEQEDWHADSRPCHDCQVVKGEFHVPSCDAEECPVCGGQLISCDCPFEDRVLEAI